MGFELRAFIGKYSELLSWERTLQSAIACKLSGELGLVPLTGNLVAELRARFGQDVTRWAKEASKGSVTAYVDIGEFGSQSHEEATLWRDGRKVLSQVPVARVLDYFRYDAGIDTQATPEDLEVQRSEAAAERWEAAAREERYRTS